MKKALKKLYAAIPFKQQFFSLLRPFGLPASLYQHLHFNGVFKVKFEGCSFLMQHYGYQIENSLYWAGPLNGWERISMQLWINLCKDAEVIIDLGANTGIYSLLAKAIRPEAQVYAFEPVQRVYDKLLKNCDLNHYDIHCLEYAVSNYDGEGIIYDLPIEHIYGATITKFSDVNAGNAIEVKVKMKKLSTFIKEAGLTKIDIMKIDVETHEPEILEGMDEYLALLRPSILVEVLTDEAGARIEALIKGMGYLYFNIDEVNKPRQVNKITHSDYFNYLLCSPETARKLSLI